MSAVLDADAVIRRFAHDLDVTVRRERRVAMTSPLYDLPGRSSLGFAAVHDVAPELVARLEQALPAEQLAARMRAPLMRPYALQLFILIEGYLMGREQLLLDAGDAAPDAAAAERDADECARVVSWFARVSAAVRGDGELFPGASVFTQPVLPAGAVGAWLGDGPREAAVAERVARALGALELYALTLHGEQRDGNCAHGPYPLEDGRWAAFQEVNDLCNDVLPWSDADVRLPLDAVGVVRTYADDVAPVFELFGTMATEPPSAPYETWALWAREGATVRPLALEELEQLAIRAGEATTRLYRRIAAWDADYRIAYGAPLFLNHLVPFARLAGVPELEPWLMERGEAVVARELPALRAGAPRSVWSRLARGGPDMFHPVGLGR